MNIGIFVGNKIFENILRRRDGQLGKEHKMVGENLLCAILVISITRVGDDVKPRFVICYHNSSFIVASG